MEIIIEDKFGTILQGTPWVDGNGNLHVIVELRQSDEESEINRAIKIVEGRA